MKMVVGLGNPGNEYQKTKHNLGFLFLEYLEEKYNFKIDKKFLDSLVYETKYGNDKILFVKPQTYMNLSGIALAKIQKFYKIEKQDIVVIFDDIDIPFETIRYKINGSGGTHNGMKNVIEQLGTKDIKRIKIGIGSLKDEHQDLKDFVLQRFSKEQLEKLQGIFSEVECKLKDIIENKI